MFWIFYLSALLPLFAAGWIFQTRRPSPLAWAGYLGKIAFLYLAGLFVAGPFLSTKQLGTDEAYNYSLSVADAVTQFRAGEFPIYVGQSEYAFSGRIHPLRTAPFLDYFAVLLDCLTFRHLNFWALQNLTLALSLIGGSFSAYACLRRATRVSSPMALALAAAYVLAPGVLAPAYGMDLYMTVMTVPFLPIIFCQCFRALDGEITFWVYALLGAALAATWLAHPPVALWTSMGVVILHLPIVFRFRFRVSEIFSVVVAAGLGSALAAFSFGAVLTLIPIDNLGGGDLTDELLREVRNGFQASLRPISLSADKLGDFQLGYVYWLMLLVVWVAAFKLRQTKTKIGLALITFYLVATTPVPGVTAWLWKHLPHLVPSLTNQWPMQRLYVLIALGVIFAFARVFSTPNAIAFVRARIVWVLLIALTAASWTGHEAWRFVSRGYKFQQTEFISRRSHLLENISPTVYSYAMLGTPSYFVNGVMDPTMEFRLLDRKGGKELASNWTADSALTSDGELQGAFSTISGIPGYAMLSPSLKLEPHKRYRLDLDYRGTFSPAFIRFIGETMMREYPLPSAGGSRAFGFMPENNHSLSLFTSGEKDENVRLQWLSPDFDGKTQKVFADFHFHEIDRAKLPVDVKSWIPLKAHVRAAESAILETPRLFTGGYRVWVNGKQVRPRQSPEHLLALAVPKGESDVVIGYRGPYALRLTFSLSLYSWIGFVVMGGFRIFNPTRFHRLVVAPLSAAGQQIWKRRFILTFTFLVVAAGVYGWRKWEAYRAGVGPMHIRVSLSREDLGRHKPILTTGRTGEGTFIFIVLQDDSHLRVGMDVWNKALYLSDPIEVDFYEDQDFVISTGALYPLDHPALRTLSAAQLDQLRNHVKVELNGKVVIDQPIFSYDSKLSEITIGASRIGGSNTEANFSGQILTAERLPIPAKP